MSVKSPGRKTYRTANGKNIDLDLLISRNELTPAVGNARVNARGDELGPGGQIIRKKEEILKDYYKQSSGVKDEIVKKEVKAPKVEEKGATAAELAEWEEDNDGNFVKKTSTRKR